MGFCNQIVVWNDGFQLGGRFINESTIGISVLFIGPFSTIQLIFVGDMCFSNPFIG